MMMVAIIQNHRDMAMPRIAPSTSTISVNTWDHLQNITNQNSLCRSRDWLPANQGPPETKQPIRTHVMLSNKIIEPAETSKQPIRTRYLGHVTGYQQIRDQYFLGSLTSL
eukprot:sb/3477268/